jgi:hypothetical protein
MSVGGRHSMAEGYLYLAQRIGAIAAIHKPVGFDDYRTAMAQVLNHKQAASVA